MNKTSHMPETLVEALRYFSDPDVCLSFMVQLRWPDGVVRCPTCGSHFVSFISTRRVWTCRENHERKQFSIKVGTIFEDSPIPLDKWMAAMWLIANAKNGISSYEIHRALGITQKSAWFMLHRIRLAMEDGSVEKLRGRVESDEIFIGGKVANMHEHKRRRVMGSRRGGTYAKAIVMGMLSRDSKQVRARVIHDTQGDTLKSMLRENVDPTAEVITDAARGYMGLSREFIHSFIDHMTAYVNGHIHTNGIENFWSLLKRAIKGTYVNVEPYHLHRYVEEQAFRYNERFGKDADRFVTVLRGIVGRRITYQQLIGKARGMAPATT